MNYLTASYINSLKSFSDIRFSVLLKIPLHRFMPLSLL
uniref:Uncharacterized protein n=1 Tax=Arundo donax TaxID=35708 RepID=A0A0A8ZL77_ARUDO